jgi:hypothetical protein
MKQQNQGESRARNRGIEEASGDTSLFSILTIVGFDQAGKADGALPALTRMDFTFTAYTHFGDVPNQDIVLARWETSQSFALEQLLVGCCINTSSIVARRSLLKRRAF